MAQPRRQMHFVLAERLGMSVRQLLASMDARELAEWEVWLNFDAWRDRIDQQRQHEMTPEQRTAMLKQALFKGRPQKG